MIDVEGHSTGERPHSIEYMGLPLDTLLKAYEEARTKRDSNDFTETEYWQEVSLITDAVKSHIDQQLENHREKNGTQE